MRYRSRFVAAVALLGLVAAPAAAQGKLSAPLAQATTGDVDWYRVAADGARVVYVARQDSALPELYSSPTDGSAPAVKLLSLPAGRQMTELSITADAATVLVIADADAAGVSELYAIPAAGGAHVRLSQALAANGDVAAAPFSGLPTAAGRVVFRADAELDERYELYSAPLDGSAAPVKLSGVLAANRDVRDSFQVSLDGSRVVYVADPNQATRWELFSAPLDGSAPPVRLNAPLPSGGDVDLGFGLPYVIAPDSSRVVYRADQLADEIFGLFGRPLDGSGSSVSIGGAMVAGADVVTLGEISLAGRIAFRADAEVDGRIDLYSAPVDGSAPPVRVNGAQAPVTSHRIAPASGRVLFTVDFDTLWSAPLDASAPPVRLDGVSAAVITDYVASPQGSEVAFRAILEDEYELWVAPIDGSAAPQRLNGALPLGGMVGGFAWSASGAWLAYSSDERVAGIADVYRVPADASAPPLALSGAPASGSSALGLQLLPGDTRVLYRADHLRDEVWELFSAPTDATAPPVRLSGAMLPSAVVGDVVEIEVADVAVAPEGGRVLYVADQDDDERYELFSVGSAGGVAPVQVSAETIASGDVLHPGGLFLDAAATRVAYLADATSDGRLELHVAPLDGGAPAAVVYAPGASDRIDTEQVRFSPAGDRIAFQAQPDADNSLRTFVAPSAGGSLALLGPGLVEPPVGLERTGPTFTRDGARVLFLACPDGTSSARLWSAPSDGSGAPVRLDSESALSAVRDFALVSAGTAVFSTATRLLRAPVDGSAAATPFATLAAGTSFVSLRLTPDGTRAVALVSGGPGPRILVAPVDGGSAPVQVAGPPVANGAIFDSPRVTPDGQRVVFAGDLEVDERFELWSAPLDGSASPARLNGALVAGGDVASFGLEFEVSPDSSRVVYRADQVVDERFELFSAPIAGGASVRLSPSLGPGGSTVGGGALAFRFSPGGRRVAFAVRRQPSEALELFEAPAAGGAARRVHPPLEADRAVSAFRYAGRRLVYVADQHADDVFELYAAFASPRDGLFAPTPEPPAPRTVVR